MSDETPHLFGREHDEWLQNDLATVYENWECDNDVDDPEQRKPFAVMEWTAKAVGEFVQRADLILEHVMDWLSDADLVLDDSYDRISDAFSDPAVVAAFESARSVLVAKLNATGWRNADECVAIHQITWDDAGEPLDNGEPLYRKATT